MKEILSSVVDFLKLCMLLLGIILGLCLGGCETGFLLIFWGKQQVIALELGTTNPQAQHDYVSGCGIMYFVLG